MLFCQTSIAQTAGPIAHWDFSGNVSDASGNGHNGTPYNITYAPGKLNQATTAAVFDGSSSYVEIPTSSNLDLNKYTLTAVLQPNGFYMATCQGNFILYRGAENNAGSYGFGFYDNAYNSCSQADTNQMVYYAHAGTTVPQHKDFQSNTKVHTGAWQCLIATFDGNTINIYVDGSLVSSAPVSAGSIGSSTDLIYLGKYNKGGGAYPYWLNATVDDIRVYDRVLDSAEINNYCSSFTGDTDPVDSNTSVTRISVSENSVTLYPNPARNNVNLHTNFYLPESDIRIYNQLGAVVRNDIHNGYDTNIDISNLPSGIYVMTFSTSDGIEIRKKFSIY